MLVCLCAHSINSSESLGQSVGHVSMARLVLANCIATGNSQFTETPSLSRQISFTAHTSQSL